MQWPRCHASLTPRLELLFDSCLLPAFCISSRMTEDGGEGEGEGRGARTDYQMIKVFFPSSLVSPPPRGRDGAPQHQLANMASRDDMICRL